MEMKNLLSKSLDAVEARSKLDASCKRLVANKIILAWIMKHSMEEYSAYSVEEIQPNTLKGRLKLPMWQFIRMKPSRK